MPDRILRPKVSIADSIVHTFEDDDNEPVTVHPYSQVATRNAVRAPTINATRAEAVYAPISQVSTSSDRLSLAGIKC
jgi:hypothetical protein